MRGLGGFGGGRRTADLLRRGSVIEAGGVSWFAPSDPIFTFTRASAATDGSPECGLPADDVDTFDVDVIRDVSAKLGAPGWALVEGARTNGISNAVDMTGTNQGSIVWTSGQADPEGGTNAHRGESPGGNHYRTLGSTGSSSSGSFIRASCWVRDAPGSYQILGGGNGTATNRRATGGSASAWQRVRIGNVAPLDAASSTVVVVSDGRDLTSFGGLSQGARDAVYAFPQVEAGVPFASSYIPTTGVAASRAADTLSSGVPAGWFDGSQVVVMEYRPNHSSLELNQIGTGDHANPFIINLYAGAGAYVRLLNGSVGTPGVGVRTSAPGAALITVTGALQWDAGDVLRFEIHSALGILRCFRNGIHQRNVSCAGWVNTAATAISYGRSQTTNSVIFGAFRVGVTPATPEETEWIDPTTDSTFTRASEATDGAPEVGLSADDVDSYAVDELRVVSSKLGGPGWFLTEGARTNDIPTRPSGSGWSVTGTVTTDPASESPLGDSQGMLVNATGAASWLARSSISHVLNDVETFSLFYREGTAPSGWQWAATGAGAIARGGNTSSAWQRNQATRSANATTSGAMQISRTDNQVANGGIAAGDRNAIWDLVQKEVGSFASSAIPTNGAVATRAADRLTWSTAKVATLGNSGVLVVEWRPERASGEAIDGGAAFVRLIKADGAIRVISVATAGTVSLVTAAGTFSVLMTWARGDLLRIEIDWSLGTVTGYRNGVPVNGTQAASLGTLDAASGWFLGRENDVGGNHFFGAMRIGRKPSRALSPLS